MLVAGGTDLLPNMKRRQQVPPTLIGLRRIAELRELDDDSTIGAGVTLTELVRNAHVRDAYRALWQAASSVATPHLRNMGTLGGNLCLDTRCNYYDQNYEWRKSIDFCMKKDGKICWVATGSPKCLAVSSTDTAPALLALGARVTLVSADTTREVAVADLYRNDGIHYLTRRPDEILTAVHLPDADGWRSAYWKLRRRGSFDFPVLSVAAAAKIADDGTVESARIVLGAVASRPIETNAVATRRPAPDRRSHRGGCGGGGQAGEADGQHRLRPDLAQARDEGCRHLRAPRAARRRRSRVATEAIETAALRRSAR